MANSPDPATAQPRQTRGQPTGAGASGCGSELRAIVDAISDAIFVHDGATAALIEVNTAACRLWGRPREDILAHDIAALSCNRQPYTQIDAVALLERARQLGPQTGTWLARHADGREFWVELSANAGTVTGREYFFVTARDISRRKTAEDQVRASEQTFRDILDSVHEAICVQDADGRLLEVNHAAELLFGLTRDRLIGRSPSEFAAPGRNDFQQMHDAVRKTFAGQPQLFEFWCRRDDGVELPREVSVTPGRYFGRPAAIAVLRDIADRKQAETERERAAMVLRESEERFRLLLGKVPSVAVQGYSAEGTVRYWNAASERLYGYTAGEALGRNLLDLIIPPPLRAHVREAIRSMAETGRAIPAGEIDLMRKDGTLVSVHSSHAVVRTAHAGPQLYCLDIDLTERKRAERERLDVQQRLMRADKLESLAVLAGGVAHDFNNLLTAILGNLDLARIELAENPAALESVDSAHDAARAAAELARQMLAFSGRSRMMLAPLDLGAFVADQLAELRDEMPAGVPLHFAPPGRPLPIVADADQLRQVLRNLVLNAAEALAGVSTPRITLGVDEVECDTAMLELSRTDHKPQPGRFVALDVSDNGAGMDEATQRRMFEPFFTTRFAGRGLGLPVVMGVVRAHRGALLVRSAPEQGTSVRVLLPASTVLDDEPPPSPDLAPVEPHAAAAPAQPPHPLLLLVDDDPFVRMVFTRMAPLLNLDLVAAESGEEAVRMFQPRADEFSIAILDLTLPGMSGWECHDVLHALRPELPIVISSGAGAEASPEEFAKRQVAGVLPKPFTIEGLQQVLAAVGIGPRG